LHVRSMSSLFSSLHTRFKSHARSSVLGYAALRKRHLFSAVSLVNGPAAASKKQNASHKNKVIQYQGEGRRSFFFQSLGVPERTIDSVKNTWESSTRHPATERIRYLKAGQGEMGRRSLRDTVGEGRENPPSFFCGGWDASPQKDTCLLDIQ
jgi:hypothetical protein